jgi:hypothetical protein
LDSTADHADENGSSDKFDLISRQLDERCRDVEDRTAIARTQRVQALALKTTVVSPIHRNRLMIEGIKFVSARRSFHCAQHKLQQVAGATAPQISAVTSAFDDFSWQPYDKLWRINVLRVVVSFLFRIRILWINARGIWYLVAVR